MNKSTVRKVLVSDVVISDRGRIEYGDILKLSEDIETQGLINPITVLEYNEETGETKYKLLAGGRRFTACSKLNWEYVPATVYSDISEYDEVEIELMENLSRLDLSFLEQCSLERKLHDLMVSKKGEKISKKPGAEGHSLTDTAKLLGKSTPTISSHVAIAEMVEKSPRLRSLVEKCKTEKEIKALMRQANQLNEIIEVAELAEENKDLKGIQRSLIDSYIISDVLEGLAKLEDNSYKFAEVDPPYGIDIDKHKKKSGNVLDYKEVESNVYIDWLEKVLSECYRVLSDKSWIVLWYDIKKHNEIFEVLKSVGFSGRNIPGVWTKKVGQTQQPSYYLASCCEYFLYARKGEATFYLQGRSNIFNFKPVSSSDKIHLTERPIELMNSLINIFCRPIDKPKILVPFLGSGNTLLSASNYNLEGVGFDLGDSHRSLFVDRVLHSIRPYKSDSSHDIQLL